MVAKRQVGRGNRGKPVGVNPLRESHEWGSYIVKKGKVAGGVVVVVVLCSHRVRGCDAAGPVKRANEMGRQESYTERVSRVRREYLTQEWFDRMHDRASDCLHGLDDWEQPYDLSDQIYIGGYCLDRVID